MKVGTWCALGLGLLALAGCGGSGSGRIGSGFGEVSGTVFDINGDVVREAAISVVGYSGVTQVLTNSAGQYVLRDVPEIDATIQAEVTVGGVRFVGRNLARVYDAERAKSVNITVVRASQAASIKAVVEDQFGYLLEGARVFVVPNNDDALSGAAEVTGDSGECTLRYLQAGVEYLVIASGRGYSSDMRTVVLAAGETKTLYFVLGDSVNPDIGPPEDLSAVAWTSPNAVTRSPEQKTAVEAFKRWFADKEGRPRPAQTRTSNGGNMIEIDLYWDPIVDDNLQGFGIYRGTSSSGSLSSVELLRDPTAAYYADNDPFLYEDRRYYYEVTTLNADYPDSYGSESDPSDRVSAIALGDMVALTPAQSPLVFRWLRANGAEQYKVYLYSDFPNIGLDPFWESALTTGIQMGYDGPNLNNGQRYYFIVLGLANNNNSRTISEVGSFVKN